MVGVFIFFVFTYVSNFVYLYLGRYICLCIYICFYMFLCMSDCVCFCVCFCSCLPAHARDTFLLRAAVFEGSGSMLETLVSQFLQALQRRRKERPDEADEVGGSGVHRVVPYPNAKGALIPICGGDVGIPGEGTDSERGSPRDREVVGKAAVHVSRPAVLRGEPQPGEERDEAGGQEALDELLTRGPLGGHFVTPISRPRQRDEEPPTRPLVGVGREAVEAPPEVLLDPEGGAEGPQRRPSGLARGREHRLLQGLQRQLAGEAGGHQ